MTTRTLARAPGVGTLAFGLLCTGMLACTTMRRESPTRSNALPPGVEAISLLGDTLRTLPLAPAVRARYEQQLAEAKRAYDHTPTNVDSIIWYARRLGYLGRLRESIAVYTRGAALYPNDPWIYRHRGHRYISVREFDNAARDLERAAQLVAGKPDIVEQDGQPNAANQPIGSLHSNINYHLALAYYLKGDHSIDCAGSFPRIGSAANPGSAMRRSLGSDAGGA